MMSFYHVSLNGFRVNTYSSWGSNPLMPTINQKPFAKASCGERFRILYCFFLLNKKGSRKPYKRSHVYIPFQGSEMGLTLKRRL